MNKYHAERYGNWFERAHWADNWSPDTGEAPPPSYAELCFIRDTAGRFTYYIRDDGSACLVDYHGSPDEATLTVPDTVDGLPVTGINWARCHDFESRPYDFDPETVILPDSVLDIGDMAFNGFSRLKHIRMPAALETIGSLAFAGCMLDSICLPDSLRSIGHSAFYQCLSLTAIHLPSQLKAIPNLAFFGCTVLSEVDFPADLAFIGHSAFCGCQSLHSISLPENDIVLSPHCFANCTSLTHVSLSHFISSIPQKAFANCTALRELHIPRSARQIAFNAFDDCPNLTVCAGLGSFAESVCRRNKIPFAATTC